MCGITGIYFFNRESTVKHSLLDSMCSSLHHRGPDSRGIFIDEAFGFGMTRLKIIDLETGEQPIFSQNKSIGIIFNGEIYNFKELKEELKSRGYKFKTKSDTEVILRAYEAYGTQCLDHLRGMFAIAIWNSRKKKLFLARDRVGQKPLFYYEDSKKIVFASEIKAILSVKKLNMEIDYDALNDYLHYGFIPGEKTVYKNIRKLPPGTYLTISQDGKKEIKKYWEIPRPRPVNRPLDEWLTELDYRLKDAVKCRLVSDVPLGIFLSGGLDSSIIAGIMSDITSMPIKSFTIGFQDKSFDESNYAQIVSRHFGTSHFQKIMPLDFTDEIIDILDRFDEPFADSSALPTFLLSRFAREKITVALSGDGGDEIFGGYQRYISRKILTNYLNLPKFFRENLESFFLGAFPNIKGYRGSSFINLFKQGFLFAKRLQRNPEDLIPVFFEEWQLKDLVCNYKKNTSWAQVSARNYKNSDPISQMMWTDFSTYLVDDLLVKVDRMSMANSLEVRCPFLDHFLIEFLTTVPVNLKIRGKCKKFLLKKYCEGKLPKDLIYRKKHGFSIPLSDLLRGSLRPLVEELLIKRNTLEFLSHKSVKTLVNAHFNSKFDFSKQIWALFVLSLWWKRNVTKF